MAKAIGLHCIIGEISKRKEKYYKSKYNLSKGTYREIKEERKLQETSQYTSSNDIKTKYEKPSNTIQEHQSKCAPITVTKIKIPRPKSHAKELHVIGAIKKWSVDQNYTQQRILHNIKQCQ